MPQPYLGPATRDAIKAQLADIADAVNSVVRDLPAAAPATRAVTVTTSDGSPALVAAAGTFTPSDVSAAVTGTGIPAGTTLATVTSDTAATLTVAATAAGTVEVTLEAGAWPAHLERGANMLGSRLFRRRNSPSGVETFAGDGVVYVQRNDPDIALLLRVGRYTAPAVG